MMAIYLTIIKKRLYLCLLIIFVSTLISAIYNYLYIKNDYEAVLTLYVNSEQPNHKNYYLQEIKAGRNLATDFRELVKSRLIIDNVLKSLRQSADKDQGLMNFLKFSDSQMTNRIYTTFKGESRILEIRVRDEEPNVSKLVANRIGDVFIVSMKNLLNIKSVTIIDYATVPEVPVTPNRPKNIILSTFVGVFVSLILSVLFGFQDNIDEKNN